MIPKIIHYCWFGRNPKPRLAEKCINSWKKYCKGYELIEWNEDNFDVASAPLYVRQAYESQKWAFVTDYVRLWAMVKYGGVYMDTDVEVIKPIDIFLEHQAFSGFEDGANVPTGIMACEKDFSLFKEFLQYYNTASFFDENGKPMETTNVVLITEMCKKRGLKQNNSLQNINGFVLYPKEYFCPISDNRVYKTINTTTIHWFAGSWVSVEKKKELISKHKENIRYKRKEKRNNIMHTFLHLPNRFLLILLGDKKYNKLKSLIFGVRSSKKK